MVPRLSLLLGCSLTFALIGLVPVPSVPQPALAIAQKGPERELVDQVKDAMDKCVEFLRAKEAGRGDWEKLEGDIFGKPGACTSLALLAMLNAGVPPEDPTIQRALPALRKITPTWTYVVGLQTMVYALSGDKADAERIQKNVDWLIRTRIFDGDNNLLGWGYSMPNKGSVADNSNTQYALLGLHEAHVAGAHIPAEVWQSIRDFYIKTQKPDGGWGYRRGPESSFTMTTAGLCGLLIAGMDLAGSRGIIQADGTHAGCGQYAENEPAARALRWLARGLPPVNRWEDMPNAYYAIYGLERAGRLSGHRFIGDHDWYREGCEFLVSKQKPDGSWSGRGPFGDGNKIVGSSFALLFLSKGRTPVLISKLAHGEGDDWNNDRNDARHLVEFSSKHLFKEQKVEVAGKVLFKKQPLAWQVFDIRRQGDLPADRIRDLAAELLASPIVYFNGHEVPRLTGAEKELLREYVENGGFILADACCGREEFDRGFRKLMDELFPQSPLRPLQPEHPVWTAAGPKFAVLPNHFKREVKLMGIQKGCKTVVVYSPQDLSCWWESNQHDKGEGALAFKLAANIIAYATGLEAPQPRGFRAQVVRDEPADIRRGFLTIGQLEHEGDWRPAPQAMRNLLLELRDAKKTGLDADTKVQSVKVANNPVVGDFRFLYMHGRAAFSFQPADLKPLRFNLETGGILLADACCGSKTFDKSFREFIRAIWHDKPDVKLEPIPLKDELFSAELNGTALTKVRCRQESGGEQREVDPHLEGVKIDGRWVVIYSKYDIGCALEKHQSPDCLGHDYPSAVAIGRAVVLYAMKP